MISPMKPIIFAETQRFEEALEAMPKSGGGGLHPYLLKLANLGRLAFMGEEEIFDAIRPRVEGSRDVPDSEIWDAITTAFSTRDESSAGLFKTAPRIDGNAARAALISSARGVTADDIRHQSPVPIDWPTESDPWNLLSILYTDEQYLFIGDDRTPGVLGRSIRRVADWKSYFLSSKGSPFPKVVPNALSGKKGLTKAGKASYRADSCVTSFRFVVAEFDNLPLADQVAFWYAVDLPVSALIHSGAKSIHAWIRVDCADVHEWEDQIENGLFPEFLAPLGLDPSCRNESRLSRMPGHLRNVNGQLIPQRLLYLSPEGRPIHE